MTNSPLYDVLHYTNHIFSESSWHPLSSNLMPTHPSPTQTKHTHKPTHNPPFMTISPLYDVLHYTNHIFSEIWWHLLSNDPLTNHPHRPYHTHKTHLNPPHMTIFPHDTNQICLCRLLFNIPMTTHPLPPKSWHSEFRTIVQGLVFLIFSPGRECIENGLHKSSIGLRAGILEGRSLHKERTNNHLLAVELLSGQQADPPTPI